MMDILKSESIIFLADIASVEVGPEASSLLRLMFVSRHPRRKKAHHASFARLHQPLVHVSVPCVLVIFCHARHTAPISPLHFKVQRKILSILHRLHLEHLFVHAESIKPPSPSQASQSNYRFLCLLVPWSYIVSYHAFIFNRSDFTACAHSW